MRMATEVVRSTATMQHMRDTLVARARLACRRFMSPRPPGGCNGGLRGARAPLYIQQYVDGHGHGIGIGVVFYAQ